MVYNFDDFAELSVPEGAGEEWRIAQCKRWFKLFAKSAEDSFILTGSVLPSEIEQILKEDELDDMFELRYKLLTASNETIRKRLVDRGYNEQQIQAAINWQKVIEEEVRLAHSEGH